MPAIEPAKLKTIEPAHYGALITGHFSTIDGIIWPTIQPALEPSFPQTIIDAFIAAINPTSR